MIIKSLTIQCLLIRCLTIRSLTIRSLTSKTRFFELFIENKNLIKQGLYLLEICQNAVGSMDLVTDRRGNDGSSLSRWIVVVMTDRRGHDGPSWTSRPILVQFLLLLSSLPSTASMTDRHRHDGPSRVFVPKHLNSWNMGTGITSLNFMMNLQNGLSWNP